MSYCNGGASFTTLFWHHQLVRGNDGEAWIRAKRFTWPKAFNASVVYLRWVTMRWIKILAALIICWVGLKVVWALAYPTSEHRFRLTVNVETPMGLKSGSSVMETVVTRQPGWNALRSGFLAHAELNGEAVFVDLGPTTEGKPSNLIALLAWGPRGTGPDFAEIPRRAFSDYLDARQQDRNKLLYDRKASPKAKASLGDCENGDDNYCVLAKLPVGTKREVRGDLVPTLITLTNIDDPKSAQVVRPDALQGRFGAGFRLRDVSLEFVTPSSWPLNMFGMGGEPLTRKIEIRLPRVFESFQIQPQSGMRAERIEDPFVLRRPQLKLGD